jgi:alpha-1,6-mannosyltransferase
MRICDIAQFHSPLSGGVKRYLADKRRALAAIPRAHHILVIPSHRDAVTRECGATTWEVRSPRLIGSASYRLLLARRRILDIVESEKPDLIEVGDPYRSAWIGREAARRIGIPVVANYHSDFPHALGRTLEQIVGTPGRWLLGAPINGYLRHLYNRMDVTVAATSKVCANLGAMGIQRVVRIPLGTDTAVFGPRDSRERVRAELGLLPEERLLLFVGRLAREKNIRELIGALDRIPAGLPPRRLLLVGDGELRAFVEAEARRRDDLIVLPYCDSADRLAELYSAADLFVHAGTWETFGLAAVEAQACGTPVMLVRGGGLEDATSGEPRPCVATDASSPGLAAAMAERLPLTESAPARLERHARIARQFSIASTFRSMFALYRHLIAGGTAESFAYEPTPTHELASAPLQPARS